MSGSPADGGRPDGARLDCVAMVAPTLGSARQHRIGRRGFIADRNGAVAVEFALVSALLVVPFLVLLADSMQRITGERRLQEAMHLVAMTVASDPGRLDDRDALLAMAADVAATGDLALEVASVCYCPDTEGVSAAPIACQNPCSGRLTFHSLELSQAATTTLPFVLPFDEVEASGRRARALVLAR